MKKVEAWLSAREMKLSAWSDTPMSTGYQPELDTSPELNASAANWYQSAIGALQWLVQLGRLDITKEVSMLASHMALLR